MIMRRLASIILCALSALTLYSQEKLKFAFLTDLHYSEGSASGKYIQACVEDINSQSGIDFALVGGDITDFGTDEELSAVKSILDGFRIPCYTVAGNHDAKWSESGCNTFLKEFGYEHFEFECGGWRFFGCNSGPDMRMSPALLPRDSMDWLESMDSSGKSIFINHFPMDSSVLNYFDVTKALKKADTRLQIGGHWHHNTVLDFDGIPGVLCRSTLPSNGIIGYTIFTLEDECITACERRAHVGQNDWETLEPWFEKKLGPVADMTVYDEHGVAESYPWMRYDVNDKYPNVKELWRIQESSNIASGFALKGNTAFYATVSGSVSAISLKNGKTLWTRQFPGKIFSTPAVCGRILVFGCTDGNVYALSSADGRELWRKSAGKSVLGSPLIRDGAVYIGDSDGCFRALRLSDGSEIWTYSDVKGFVESTPYVDESQVVFGTWANKLYSLDPRDGRLQWIWECAKPSRMYSPAATVPVKSSGRIFVALPDRRIYAIDAASGKQLFYVSGGREAIGLSEDGQTVYGKTMYHKSYAFPASVCVSPQEASSSPALLSPSAAAFKLSVEGELPKSALKWEVENGMGYEISPTPVVEHQGVVYFPSDKGNLVALSAEDGSYLWAHKLSLALINPIRVWSGRKGTFILVSTMDGVVSLLQVM